MKKVVLFFVFMVSTTFLFAQQQVPAKKTLDEDVIEGKRPPTHDEAKLMKAEENNNADIAKANQAVDAAIDALKKSTNDYGGYKAQALADLGGAYISLRKAVYYRLAPPKKK